MGRSIYSNAFRAFVFVLCGLSATAQTRSRNHPATGEHPVSAKKTGLDFIENKGQWIPEAKFKADIPDGALFVTDQGFVYNYASRADLLRLDEHNHEGENEKGREKPKSDLIHYHAYKVAFAGANTNIKYASEEKRSNYNNYILGNDPSRWAGHVGLYGKVKQQNVYNGIDVDIYSKNNSLKYDFVVSPGANAGQIRLTFEGVTPALKPDGSLYIKTSVNEVTELAPYSYQVINGQQKTVKSAFKLEKGQLTFEFPEGYDATQTLVIDPVLVFATYSGGTNTNNYSYTTTYDANGNLYAGAECWSTGWPVTLGSFQQTFGGTRDIGINKYNATGSSLIYSTYYGGNNYDLPHAMRVNEQDELVLVGSTQSIDLPVTSGCYDNTIGGGADMFVAHFNSSGANLIGASYLGGSNMDPFQFTFNATSAMYNGGPVNLSSVSSPMELTFDKAGNIWVVGNTNSTDIDIVAGGSQNSYTKHKWICAGSSYVFGNQTLTTSGNYTHTFTTPGGCDSFVKLTLKVGPAIRDTVSAYICPGSTYTFGQQVLHDAGTYLDTFTSAYGCDSFVTLHLFLKPYITGTVSKQICPGTTYTFGSQVLSNAGTYVDTFSTAAGCDSIATLTLSIKPYISNSISQNICAGKSYTFGTQVLHNAGTYIDTFSTTGCDSIVTLSLTVNPYVRDTVQATFCPGAPYRFGNQLLSAAGTYIDTITSLASCDKIITLQLTSGTAASYRSYASICQGGSYTFGTQTLTTPGNYTTTFTTSGCDSIVTLHLEYRPNITNSVTAYMCPGGSYQFGSQLLTTTGTYTQTFATAACDSVVTLTLGNNPVYNDTMDVEICQGTSYVFGPTTLLNAGTYTHTFASATGCDSTVTIHLGFKPYIATFIADSICTGGSYTFGNQTLTAAGTYIQTYPTTGCDSVVTLALSIRPIDTFTYTENYCTGSNYYFGDTILTSAGTFYKTFTQTSGCDSVVRLILTAPWANSGMLSGGIDVVLFKLDSSCSQLLYSAYLGGGGDDSPTGLLFNNDGKLIVTGITSSTNFPTTTGTLHPTAPGGVFDGFVAIIDPDYGNMVRCTYLGTDNIDQAVNVQVDDSNNVYVLGRTTGAYPITSNVYVGNPNGDVFIEKLDPILSQSLLSTRVGNNQNAGRYFPSAFLVDICRNVYVAGFSSAAGAPLSQDAYQTAQASFWFGVLQPNFSGLLFGSYFGVGTADHNHIGVNRLDPNGIVYHSICNAQTTFVGTTANSWSQNKQTTGQDIMSFKFNFEATGVQSNFELAANQNDTGCAPYTVTFTNTSNAATSYVWDFGDNTTSTVANPTHTFTDSGTYRVALHAINPNTCITDDTSYFTIRVLKTVMPDIVVNDTVLCAAEQNINLHVVINNPSPNNTISWAPNTGIVGASNLPTVTVDPNQNTIYRVTVKDTIPGICGFSVTDTVHIDLAPRVLAIQTPDTAVCQGTVISLRASGTPAYSYVWSPSTGISDSTILQPTLTVNQSGIYTLTGSYASCPDTTVSISIEMQAYPQLTLNDDFGVCQGTDVSLLSAVAPYRPDYIYQWSPATPNLTNPTGPNTHFIADTSITYHLLVKTPIGCSDEDSIVVTVFPGGFGNISPDTGYCPGPDNYASLVAGGGSTYRWTPTDGLSSASVANPTAQPHSSTDYTVYITDIHNCVDTEHVSVQVYPMPLLSLPDSINIYHGETYHIEPNTNASYFSWFPPSGISDVNIADPVMSPQVRTRYFATARTTEGCLVVDSVDVIVNETVIDMPNAFAPNGGVNNIFKPAKRGIATLKEFAIYNRWGNKVYSSTNIEAGWDGTYNGKPQPMGVYVYSINAVTDSGHEFVQKGNLTLIR